MTKNCYTIDLVYNLIDFIDNFLDPAVTTSVLRRYGVTYVWQLSEQQLESVYLELHDIAVDVY